MSIAPEIQVAKRRAAVSIEAALAALDLTGDAVFFASPDLRIVRASAAASRQSGYRKSQLRQLCLCDILVGETAGMLGRTLDLLPPGGAAAFTAQMHCKSGKLRPVDVDVQMIESDGAPLLVAIARRRKRSNRLTTVEDQENERDYLTGLFTRAALERRLRQLQERYRDTQSRIAVLFVDLDCFKQVNDRGGHRTGDAMLAACGQRLMNSVRPGDFVARYGGDEFVILMEDFGEGPAVGAIAERIGAELTEPHEIDRSAWRIAASVGVAIGRPYPSAQALVDEADAHMYRIKRTRSKRRLDPKSRRTLRGPTSPS
jgi:diguanylate cyclase (GGDEF)-like protein